jgi:hypothetical protein
VELNDDDPSSLRELLDHIRLDAAWQLLWQHLLMARQDSLLRMAGAENWEQCLLIRGELNAINVLLEWGDDLALRLEQAQRSVEEDNGRFGRS